MSYINKLKNLFNLRLFKQFITTYVIVLIVPVIIVFYMYNLQIISTIENQIIEISKKNLEKASVLSEQVFGDMAKILGNVSNSKQFSQYQIKSFGVGQIDLIAALRQIKAGNVLYSEILYHIQGDTNFYSSSQKVAKELVHKSLIDMENLEMFLDDLDNLDAPKLYPLQSVVLNGAEQLSIIKMYPVSEGAVIVFFIDGNKFRNLLGNISPDENEKIYLKENGSLIAEYQNEKTSIEKNSLMNINYYNNSFEIGVEIFKDAAFNQIINVQKSIYVQIALIVLIGIILIIISLYISYNPIYKLYSNVRSNNKYDELKSISFEIENISKTNKELKRIIDVYKPYLQRFVLNEIGKNNPNSFINLHNMIFEYEKFCIMVMESKAEESEILNLVSNISDENIDIYFIKKTNDMNIFLVNTDYDYENEKKLLEIVNELEDLTNGTARLGKIYRNIIDMAKSYIEVVGNSVSYEYPYKLLNEFGEHAFSGNAAAAGLTTQKIFGNMSDDVPMFFKRCLILEILNLLTKAMIKKGISYEESIKVYDDFLEYIDSNEPDPFEDKINEALKKAFTQIEELTEDKEKYVLIFKEYLKENMFRQDFSLKNMAFKFERSVSYISNVFKNSTGENISDYIWRSRCEKAKDLLKNSDMPINDIALDVGYLLPNSFIRKFKNDTGMTPGKYRQQ